MHFDIYLENEDEVKEIKRIFLDAARIAINQGDVAGMEYLKVKWHELFEQSLTNNMSNAITEVDNA